MSFIKNVSLSTKLIGLVVTIVVTLGAAGTYCMFQMKSKFQQGVLDGYNDSAAAMSESIAAQYYERYGDVQAFAVNPYVRAMDAKAMQPDLDTYVDLYGIYDLILVVDVKGHYVASSSKSVSGQKVNVAALRDYDFSKTEWFQNVSQKHFTEDTSKGFTGTYFEDPLLDPVMKAAFGDDHIVTGFTTEVKDHSGKVVGFVTNRANTKWYDNELKSHFVAQTSAGEKEMVITLVNKQGLVITEISGTHTKYDLDYDTGKTFLKRDFTKEHLPAGKLGMTGSGSVISKDKDGSYDVVGYAHLDAAKWTTQNGWSVYVHDDLAEALRTVNTSMRLFYIIFGIFVAISVVGAVAFSLALAKSISSIAKTLDLNSNNLAATSQEVATTSSQIAESATEQAAALQETVASVDEISAMVGKNAESAKSSQTASGRSRSAAERGQHNIERMVAAIEEISRSNEDVSQQMDRSNAQFSDIVKVIEEISAKTKVINDIVFQTKLLSFNASVEAARAGEHGKGFAVVAEEVGNLAQMSGNAANEISKLLDESVTRVESIVKESKDRVESLMVHAKSSVDSGSETARACSTALQEILNEVSSVDTMVGEISVASQEQAKGVQEIAKAMAQMETTTQQNSSASSASSRAAGELSHQSLELKTLVQELTRIVTGSSAIDAPRATVHEIRSKSTHSKDGFSRGKSVVGSDVPSHTNPGFEDV